MGRVFDVGEKLKSEPGGYPLMIWLMIDKKEPQRAMVCFEEEIARKMLESDIYIAVPYTRYSVAEALTRMERERGFVPLSARSSFKKLVNWKIKRLREWVALKLAPWLDTGGSQ